ncbi:CRTAC1 family protein [Candidatus Poribacteria bacterium]|nr:MAG: CRTAC1 family protein [Candidatus Poribacteria bacterium]
MVNNTHSYYMYEILKNIVIVILSILIPNLIIHAESLPHFTEITTESGLNFIHNNGAFGEKYLPETMGSGCAFIDYNQDGWVDIFLVNCKDWEKHNTGKSQTPALFQNQKDGTFKDVTIEVGLNIQVYGMGVAVGDYDNDGDDDIYLSCLYDDKLFRNNGDGTFKDVTEEAGITNPGFGTSCAWFDYNLDGLLDLYVANYVEWTIKTDIYCTLDGQNKSYCTPESYSGQASILFRNRGNGTFVDVSRIAGVSDPKSKSLGVCILDYNADGLPDIFEANDTQPNKLYQNNGDGTFIEVGMLTGVAFNENGVATGAMGVDAGDYDNSGNESLIIGNFSNEMINLYKNEGDFFIDDAPIAKIGQPSLLTLTFGCFFFDFDLDGKLDIFTTNGHVETDINLIQSRVSYPQPPHLFRNVNGSSFTDVIQKVGNDLLKPVVGRGTAYGDIDNDGDPDILVTTSNGPVHLYRNDGGNKHNWLKIKLVGQKSNRNGLGARIEVISATGTQTRTVRSGSSYCSQSELTVFIGIKNDQVIDKIKVEWQNGNTDILENIKANQEISIKESL